MPAEEYSFPSYLWHTFSWIYYSFEISVWRHIVECRGFVMQQPFMDLSCMYSSNDLLWKAGYETKWSFDLIQQGFSDVRIRFK